MMRREQRLSRSTLSGGRGFLGGGEEELAPSASGASSLTKAGRRRGAEELEDEIPAFEDQVRGLYHRFFTISILVFT
jgi:hypothetical protein